MNEQTWNNRWPLERALFVIAGIFVLGSAVLSALVSPWFLLLTGFVALNMLLFASVGFCGTSLLLMRAFGFKASCRLEGEEA